MRYLRKPRLAWPRPTRCPLLVSSAVRRISITASLVTLTLLFAACSSSPQTKAIPSPNLGVSLHEAEKFFNGMGGGGWRYGEYTGGVVGYAAGDGHAYYCDVLLSGRLVALNRVFVGCAPDGPNKSTPQQAAKVFDATVHRFAPDASQWAEEITAGLTANPSSAVSNQQKIVNSKSVDIQQSSSGATLTIEPEVLAKEQPAPG